MKKIFEGVKGLTNIGYLRFIFNKMFFQLNWSSVTSFGDYTFCECSSLEENLIPSSDKEIGIVIFGECLSLSHITISPFVKSIEKRTFI